MLNYIKISYLNFILFIFLLLPLSNVRSNEEINICHFGADGDYPELEQQKEYIN